MKPISIYIDADACPVKQETYRVAERHALKGTALKILVVSNSPIAIPRDAMIERVVVGAGMDEADDWIAERATRGDIVITADVPLASRCVKAGADVIAPNGRAFTEDTIGMTLATRNLMDSLRSAGEITGGGGGSDIAPLLRDGVPGLSERTVGTHYFDWHHTEADTLDKVSLDDFRKNLASLAVMGFALADMPGRLTAATGGGRAPR